MTGVGHGQGKASIYKPWGCDGARRLPGVLAMTLVAAASAGPVWFTCSQSFDLGPGETTFGLTFPQFNRAAHPEVELLEGVEITLEATFRAAVMLQGSEFMMITGDWSLGTARVEALPRDTSVSLRPVLDATLSGSLAISSRADVVISPVPTVTVVTKVASVPADLGAFEGAGTLVYDVDFAARYSQVAAGPQGVTGLYAGDRVTGQLSVTYRASSSDTSPVVLSHFRAQRRASGVVVVGWEARAEQDVRGFRLERQGAVGAWVPVTPALLPALGAGGQSRRYEVEDEGASGMADLRYRLVAIDAAGTPHVTGETGVQTALELTVRRQDLAIELALTGPAGMAVALEGAPALSPAAWTVLREVTLAADGHARLTAAIPAQPFSFYRARQR